MRQRRYYKRRKGKKEEKEFHIFIKTEFIKEKDLKQVLKWFIKSSHIY